MLCSACAARDEIDCTVFHESAHITSDSFEEVEPERIRDLVKKWFPYVDADKLDLPSWYKGRRVFVQVLTNFIEPVCLPTVQNVVEDIYVNRRLFKHRPGCEPSIQCHQVKVFNKGFHQADGTHVTWGEQPLDAQVIMGVLNIGARLPHLNQNLDPKIDELITSDEVLNELMEAIPGTGDAYVRAEIGLRTLARLRELGFCIPPSQQEQPPEPQGEDGDSEEEGQDGEDESSEPSPGGGTSGTGSTKGVEASDEDEDAEAEAQDGEPSEDGESEDGEPSGAGTQTSGDDGESKDDEQEADDAEGSGSEESDDEESEDEPQGSGSGDDEADEEDRDDDAEGSGSGQQDDDSDDAYEGDDDKAEEEPQPTPEELDKAKAEELAKLAKQMMGHEEQEQEDGNYTEPEDGLVPMGEPNDEKVEKELDSAIRWQKFDAPPKGVHDFQEIEAKVDPDLSYTGSTSGWPAIDFDPGLVSGETARLRTVFALNRKRRITGSLKSGPKLDVRNLHRVGQEDFRIFGRQDRPDRRDWFVLVGLDDSGSTLTNGAAKVIREMGLGIGEMLNGVGVKFAMYAHSGRIGHKGHGIVVTHKVVKGPDEPWTPETKERLQSVCREDTGNLDGHTLEQYRKVIQDRRETDKMILYVTDGAMPMANYNEELEVLQRELAILRQRRVNLFGVGYRTDSPSKHGMDTVVIEDGQDLPGLISGLRQRLEV